jgi:hypothetical protein
MAYQISEKNQILLALFAIVVLCAGKLFKDYLYRGGYIEGLTVVPVSDTVPRRPVTNATLYLNLTLGATLATEQTINVSWVAGKGVTMSSKQSDYSAQQIVTGGNGASLASELSGTTATFKLTETLNSGSKIKISVSGVNITNDVSNTTVVFTTNTTTETTPVTTTINILGSSAGSLSESSSAEEIRAALASIKTRLDTNPNDAELLKIQSALVNVLAYTYGTIKEAGKVFDSDALYEAQKTAIDFIAKEKARAAANANTLKQDNTNKRRMAQVNTYYTRNYEANTEVMKNIIYVSVALIVLAILRNKELIPASISTLGVIFVLTMGGIVIGRQVFDIIRRNDHDFDKYDWTFNEDQMNNKFVQQNPDSSSLMDLGMGGAPCYGPGCCDTGTRWDAARGLCASSGGALSSQGSSAVWTTGTLTITMKISQSLVTGDNIYITLPSGVFTPATSGGNASIAVTPAIASSSVSKTAAEIASEILLQVATAGVTAPATVSINITGISVSPSADKSSIHNVKVATSKEPIKIDLRISGLPRP